MIKKLLFIILTLVAIEAKERICKDKIYLDKYLDMKNIPLNIKLFDAKIEQVLIPKDKLFFNPNYGMQELEYEKIVDLHYFLDSNGDSKHYCSDLRTRDNYHSFFILETLHIYLVEKSIQTQNIQIAKKLFNEYDLISGSLSEGHVFEIVMPLLIHMNHPEQLFQNNKSTINDIAEEIIGWIDANNNPYYDSNNSTVSKKSPTRYLEFRKSIYIPYTLSPLKKDEFSPNKGIYYPQFLEILKKKKLQTLAQKIDTRLKEYYLSSE